MIAVAGIGKSGVRVTMTTTSTSAAAQPSCGQEALRGALAEVRLALLPRCGAEPWAAAVISRAREKRSGGSVPSSAQSRARSGGTAVARPARRTFAIVAIRSVLRP